MILRTWRGAVRPADADRYLAHQSSTGIRAYRATPGNLGALALRRDAGDRVEVMTVSLWSDMAAVRAFAGEDPERARFYPGDDDLLAGRDDHADHWEVVEAEVELPG